MRVQGVIRFTGAVVLIAMLLLVFTACGEDEAADADNVIEEAVEKAQDAGRQIEACDIVTQQVATELFGDTAVKDEGVPVLDTNMLGECIWTWDTDQSNQLLQFRIWGSDTYYSVPDDSEPIDLGEMGNIRVNDMAGIDIIWVQEGKTVELSYFNFGPEAPELQTKVQAMKDMAVEVSGEVWDYGP